MITLPSDIKVGRKVSTISRDEHRIRGVVVEIPAHRRFAVVEFEFPVKEPFHRLRVEKQRTCFYIEQAGWQEPPVWNPKIEFDREKQARALKTHAVRKEAYWEPIAPEKLLAMIEAKGLTKKAFSEKIGVSKGHTLARWIRAEQVPRSSVQKCADALGLSKSSFMLLCGR